MITPVFIFSTPRAGSTLLQRILASHQDIATTAEPWILLPLLSMTKDKNTLANYSAATSSKAIENFTLKIKGENDYNTLLANFILSLYQAATTNNESFFIDKTPRYYYLIEEIVALFPQAKFIFLFRNPVQTFSSVLTTWTNNKFYKLYRNIDDLYLAPKLLAESYEKHQQHAIAINYDDLVNESEHTIKKIYQYLGIDSNKIAKFECNKDHFAPEEMGDPTAQDKYNHISHESINAWQNIFNTPIRKWFLKRYINTLGDKVALMHGYSKTQVIKKIDTLANSTHKEMFHDILGISYQWLVYKLKLNLIFPKRSNKKGFYD